MADTKTATAGLGNGNSHLDADGKGEIVAVKPQTRKLHDPAVSFEEYHHYARLTRAAEEQRHLEAGTSKRGILETLFPPKSSDAANTANGNGTIDEKAVNINDASQRMEITDGEWVNASRAMRTATYAAIFYLITTDILGPFGVPYVI